MSKKKNYIIAGVAVVVIAGAAYLSFGGQGKTESKTVTIGVMAGSKAEDEIWASTIKTAKDKYGITLKTKKSCCRKSIGSMRKKSLHTC